MSAGSFDWGDLRAHWQKSGIAERAERLSWATEEMSTITRAYTALREKGWKPIMYCPKDGSLFLAWQPSMPTPYRCKYEGTWPDGRWWAVMDGDMWPDHPVLWKPLP